MSQAAGNALKRVLIVDDSRFVRTTFNRVLSASLAVREEADGEAAWQAIQGDPSIVMVLTDLDMPKLDGYELISRIRSSAQARIRELPVVVISGSQDEASKKRARDVGANDFISKSADAPEVLSRIDNLLRLVKLKQSATHDPLTGTLTAHFLVTEGRKHYSSARRHGAQLSVMALRIDSHAAAVQKAGKEAADQLLARIAKLVAGMLRAEDTLSHAAHGTFMVVSAGTGAPQMLALARRLHEQLGKAQVSYGGQSLGIQASFGVASLAIDPAGSIEELMKLALQRLKAGVAGARPMPAPAAPPRQSHLPADVERALQVLERLDADQLGESGNEVFRRLLPLLKMLEKKRKELLPM